MAVVDQQQLLVDLLRLALTDDSARVDAALDRTLEVLVERVGDRLLREGGVDCAQRVFERPAMLAIAAPESQTYPDMMGSLHNVRHKIRAKRSDSSSANKQSRGREWCRRRQ
jgi:hypothetical protein